MHLYRIHIVRTRRWSAAAASHRTGTTIVNEFTAYLKENLNAIDEKKDDNDQQQRCIATVENVRVRLPIGHQLRWQHFRSEQTVRQQIEGEKAEKTFRQKLWCSNVTQVENLRKKKQNYLCKTKKKYMIPVPRPRDKLRAMRMSSTMDNRQTLNSMPIPVASLPICG